MVRYANRLDRGDVGSRVVVRRWVDDADDGRVQSDVLGYLEDWSEDGVLTVRTRDGERVAVPAADVVAGKTIPPPPEPRGD